MTFIRNIKVDDYVSCNGFSGVVKHISLHSTCLVESNTRVVKEFPLSEIKLVARKGTKGYAMLVEGVVPKPNKAVSKKNEENVYSISKLQDAYARAGVGISSAEDSDGDLDIDLTLTLEEVKERIDLALDLKDEEMFQKYYKLLQVVDNS